MITAMWEVTGDSAEALLREAHSDCQIAGLKTDYLNVWLMRPLVIVGGRVETWRGWAVVSRADSAFILPILMEAEWQRVYSHSQAVSQG